MVAIVPIHHLLVIRYCKVNRLCFLVQYLKMMNYANATLCWACVLLLFPLFRIFKATVMQFVVFFLTL